MFAVLFADFSVGRQGCESGIAGGGRIVADVPCCMCSGGGYRLCKRQVAGEQKSCTIKTKKRPKALF